MIQHETEVDQWGHPHRLAILAAENPGSERMSVEINYK